MWLKIANYFKSVLDLWLGNGTLCTHVHIIWKVKIVSRRQLFQIPNLSWHSSPLLSDPGKTCWAQTTFVYLLTSKIAYSDKHNRGNFLLSRQIWWFFLGNHLSPSQVWSQLHTVQSCLLDYFGLHQHLHFFLKKKKTQTFSINKFQFYARERIGI